MPITVAPYGLFCEYLGRGAHNLASDQVKLALLTADYTPDFVNDHHFDDVQGYEVAGSGDAGAYTTGGFALTNQGYGYNVITRVALFTTYDPVSWSNFTGAFRYAVLYNSSSAFTNGLIACVDFGEEKSYTGASLTLTFPYGVLSIGSA